MGMTRNTGYTRWRTPSKIAWALRVTAIEAAHYGGDARRRQFPFLELQEHPIVDHVFVFVKTQVRFGCQAESPETTGVGYKYIFCPYEKMERRQSLQLAIEGAYPGFPRISSPAQARPAARKA